jgi:SAM-dependent methyltransferase
MTASEYSGLYEHEETMWWFVGMRRLVDLLLDGRQQRGWRVLDAGCGAGFNALDLARRYEWQVFACDLSPEAIKFSGIRGVPRLAGGNVEFLPYTDSVFDCITCFDVLVMLREDRLDRALAEFFRVLRPGGLLVTRVAAMETLRGRHSFLNGEARRYALPELKGHLERGGFRVERGTYANMLLLPLAFIKRRILEPLRFVGDGSDVGPTPHWMNRICLGALEMERKLLSGGGSLPFGTSTLIVSRKPEP